MFYLPSVAWSAVEKCWALKNSDVTLLFEKEKSKRLKNSEGSISSHVARAYRSKSPISE